MPRNLGFLETFPVLAALPTSVGSGRVVTLSTDGHPYFDHSTGWLRADLQGDMLKSVYDATGTAGIVDNAEALGGQAAAKYVRNDIASTFTPLLTFDANLSPANYPTFPTAAGTIIGWNRTSGEGEAVIVAGVAGSRLSHLRVYRTAVTTGAAVEKLRLTDTDLFIGDALNRVWHAGNLAAPVPINPGTPPVLDAQSSLFSRLNNGSIAGQQGFTLSGAATATVTGPQVLAVGNFANQADYTLSPREFTTGTIRFQAQSGATGNFMLVWGLPRSGLPTANLALWTASGAAGGNLEFGWITYPAGTVTSAVTGPGTVSAGRYTIEIIHRGQAAGNVTEIRAWAESASRPVAASFSYTFLGTEPVISGSRIGLRSISTNTVSYANLEVYDAVTALRNTAMPSGYWFPYAYNGKTVLATINQGARLDCVVQNTLNFTLNVTGHPGAALQPKVAFRVDGGPIIYRTVPGTGAQALTIALPDTALHRVAVIASGINENDNVWADAQGLLVNGVTVDAGGQVVRAVDDRPVLAAIGDSITAGIVAYGQNATPPVSTPSQSAGELAYPTILAQRLNMRVNEHGFGGTGVSVGGSGGVPKALTNTLNYQSTIPLFGEDIPAIALINENTNEAAQPTGTLQTDWLALIDGLKARYPGIRILIMRPFNGAQAAVNAAVAGLRGLQYVDTTGWGVTFSDGTHPDPAGHQRAAELLYPAVVVVPVMQQVTAITGAYTALAGDSLLKADATGATFTVTLPSAVGSSGKAYTLKKMDASANVVTLTTSLSQTIDGGTTAVLSTQYLSLTVISDGANWQVI